MRMNNKSAPKPIMEIIKKEINNIDNINDAIILPELLLLLILLLLIIIIITGLLLKN